MSLLNHKFINKEIAVLVGGFSAENEISRKSGQAVTNALLQNGFNARMIEADEGVADALMSNYTGVAFVMMHGRGGEDGTIQGLLEWLQIPYTGSGVLSSALASDKIKTKQVWQMANLPSAPFEVMNTKSDFEKIIKKLNGKVMVKPVREGSSIGMSVATDAQSLKKSFEIAVKYDDLVMAEQWIDGEEYTVSIVNDIALPVIRIVSQKEFYDYEAKYDLDNTKYLIPSGLTNDQEKSMQQLAIKSFSEIGCSGWGRVDLMVDSDGTQLLLEINTVPGMTDHSLVPKAAVAIGMDFQTLVTEILTQATLHAGCYE